MRVYLMRHATAEEPGAGPDAARRLTEQGRRESREAGEALRKQTSNLAVVLTSPRLRARETAEEIVAAIGGIARVGGTTNRLNPARAHALVDAMARYTLHLKENGASPRKMSAVYSA